MTERDDTSQDGHFTTQCAPIGCPKCGKSTLRPYHKKKHDQNATPQVFLLCEDCGGGVRLWVSRSGVFEWQENA